MGDTHGKRILHLIVIYPAYYTEWSEGHPIMLLSRRRLAKM
jgi:hypothetical protein